MFARWALQTLSRPAIGGAPGVSAVDVKALVLAPLTPGVPCIVAGVVKKGTTQRSAPRLSLASLRWLVGLTFCLLSRAATSTQKLVPC